MLVPELPASGEAEGVLRGPEAHHLRDVLRLKPGAPVEAFDGAGNVADGRVKAVSGEGVVLELGGARREPAEARRALTVAVALLKGDKLSDVVRQCTELGAARFVLLATRYADVGSMSAARRQRLKRVAEEAARQSGRAVVPAIVGPAPLAALTWEGAAVVADPDVRLPLAAALEAVGGRGVGVTVITGPEGGFAPGEVDALTRRGAVAVSLGPWTLRAETAPVALTAAVLLSRPESDAR